MNPRLVTTKARAIAHLLAALVSVAACVRDSGPLAPGELAATSTSAEPSPWATASPLATAPPSPTAQVESPMAAATLAPTRTPVPPPTPTPVPVPGVCLLPEFAHDVEDCGAIPYYEIELVVEPNDARVTGRPEIRYTNLEEVPLSELFLRLFPSTPGYGGKLVVDRVAVSGRFAPTFAEVDESALQIPLFPPLAVGQALTLTMDFEVDVPTTILAGHGLFSYYRGVMALPTVFPIIPVYDDEGWNIEIAPEYSDDIYTDVAAFQVQITAPSAMTLVASGACVPETQDGETTTWMCDAAPMRDFVFILGEDFQLANRVVEGVVINSYFYPEHAAGGGRALDVAADALQAFTEMFGPYPYTELDVVETPNLLGGMEYPGLVVIQDGLYPRVAGVEWLAAHEVAHQWWFGVVGSDQIDDPWLDEALTQYSTMLYYEHVYGPDRGGGVLRTVFVDTHNRLVQSGLDLPAGLPASAYSPGQYFQVVYDKGALYFHELRQAVGDGLFFEIPRTYYARHRYKIATPESFLAVVERVAGGKYLDVYEEWIAPHEG